ncbi:hypothetical protein EVAR_13304_1 [Eumeta japonica]|uniref:Uncharacterized protein n=1 Tax=Eumeta variegata TaxID=151549 RepID=A0A4C1TRS4_EUMVA|nr:hypothetical protein EVAR_13304_1 [Eumeta japonica]
MLGPMVLIVEGRWLELQVRLRAAPTRQSRASDRNVPDSILTKGESTDEFPTRLNFYHSLRASESTSSRRFRTVSVTTPVNGSRLVLSWLGRLKSRLEGKRLWEGTPER